MTLAPQEQAILEHLKTQRGITRLEALGVYKIYHLPTRIFNLRRLGYKIKSISKRDARGTRYVRYVLEE